VVYSGSGRSRCVFARGGLMLPCLGIVPAKDLVLSKSGSRSRSMSKHVSVQHQCLFGITDLSEDRLADKTHEQPS
jgi:hypothetical protein